MKESKSFENAIKKALLELLEKPNEKVVLEHPFSGIFVSMQDEEDFSSEKYRIADYTGGQEDGYFFLVYKNMLG